MAYANWADLAAHEVEGVDYRLPIRRNNSTVVHIAIHGGGIEPGSTEIADAVAAFGAQNFYSLEGIKPSGNSALHLTSTIYDEPQGISLVKSSNYCFSFHGMAGTSGVAETYVGGADTATRDKVMQSLIGAGFAASVGGTELNGNDPANITNKTALNAGVQLEISNYQRQLFFPGNDLSRANRETGLRTDTFYKYMRAVAQISNYMEARNQTPNYRLNLADPSDSMADFQTWINSSWLKIEKAPNPDIIATPPLPQAGSYNVGDRVYLSDVNYQSSFILTAKDPFWGWVWRPIQAAISPWINVPSTAFQGSDAASYQLHPTIPFQFALDNKGNCYWRGAIRKTTVGLPNNNSQNIFATLPSGLRNATSGMYTLAIDPATPQADTGLAGYKGGRWYIQNDGFNSLRFHNASSSQDIYFTNIEYVASDAYYLNP